MAALNIQICTVCETAFHAKTTYDTPKCHSCYKSALDAKFLQKRQCLTCRKHFETNNERIWSCQPCYTDYKTGLARKAS
jgi:hypothetical protein